MTILDFPEPVDLPEGNAVRCHLMVMLGVQITALTRCQDNSSLQHTLLDDPHSYPEVSVTTGFTYNIPKTVCKRYVGQHYVGVTERAIRGIVYNISPQGELSQTSFGTRMGADLDFYCQILLTPMPYGQATAIPCLTEYLCKYF